MKLTAAVLATLMLATPALCQARVKLANYGTISFDCGNMHEVCVNMCFGVHCRGGRYGKTFTYDPAGNQVARRKAAGCGQSNRCSTTPPWKGANMSCDEFPFANSREADAGGQNNRCVPGPQNNSQGGTFTAFLGRVTKAQGAAKGKDLAPFQYNIAFTNTQGVKYCSNAGAGTCNSDPNMWIGGAVAPNGPAWTPRRTKRELEEPTFRQYMSKRGEFVTSARDMEAGEKLFHARMDKAGEAAAIAAGDEDALNAFYANPDSYELIEDEVERRATPEEIAALA